MTEGPVGKLEMAAADAAFKYSDGARRNDPAWRVVIAPGPSRRVAAWVLAVTAVALVALLSADAPVAAKAAGVPVLAAAAVRALRRDANHAGPGATRRCVVDLAGHVEWEGSDGSVRHGRLVPGSFVAPWLVVIHWRPAGAWWTRTQLVAPDAVHPDDFRRLRILLRWH